MSTQHDFYAVSFEYRRNPARADAGRILLGVGVEFLHEKLWIVGVQGRDFLTDAEVGLLDPIARDLLVSPIDLLGSKLRDVLRSGEAVQFGDVLRILAARNPWSLHVTPPEPFRDEEILAHPASPEQIVRDSTLVYWKRYRLEHAPVTPAPSPIRPWMARPRWWEVQSDAA
jgi:hypothetical protein